jgi:hypothetical protein
MGSPDTIQFNQIQYPQYVSDTVGLPYEPDVGESVCAGVVGKTETVQVAAGGDEGL